MKKGITLIALIITIIVLLILAGVSIALVIGDNGILNKATKSKKQTVIGDVKDSAELIRGEYEVEHDGKNPTPRYIIEKLISSGKIDASQVTDYGDSTGIGIVVVESENVNIIGTQRYIFEIMNWNSTYYLSLFDTVEEHNIVITESNSPKVKILDIEGEPYAELEFEEESQYLPIPCYVIDKESVESFNNGSIYRGRVEATIEFNSETLTCVEYIDTYTTK